MAVPVPTTPSVALRNVRRRDFLSRVMIYKSPSPTVDEPIGQGVRYAHSTSMWY